MKPAGDRRLNESPVSGTHGFRRLNSKTGRLAAQSGRAFPPPPQQISPSANNGKHLDTWQRVEDISGVTYYWGPQAKLPALAKPNLISAVDNPPDAYSEKSVTVGHQKIAPSGYSPNRFPISSSSAQLSPEYILSRSVSPYSSVGAAQFPSSAGASVYSNAGSSYSNVSSGGSSATYFAVSNSHSFKSNDVEQNAYENVPKSSFAALHGRSVEKNANGVAQLGKDGNIIGSNNNVIGYLARPVNVSDKKAVAFTDAHGFCRDNNPVWTVSDKQHFGDECKTAIGLRNGSSRSSVSRDKPRIPRFLQSLCCCLRPNVGSPRHQKVSVASSLSSPRALITQVKKRSANGVGLNGAILETRPLEDITNAESLPAHVERFLLPPPRARDAGKKCLIVDLDETLVHSSFKPVKNPDFVIPVEIDNVIHQVYVLKRPHVDTFLDRIGDKFECVLFTASLAKYADPVADLLDRRGVFRTRLFREACVFHKGNYVKDLTRLGRDLRKVIIVDNSPTSYAFHPDNAIAVQSWFDDMNDVELLDIIPLLEQLADVENIYSVLRNSNEDVRRSNSLDTTPHDDSSRSS